MEDGGSVLDILQGVGLLHTDFLLGSQFSVPIDGL
jgi:hypothetical protein